jgi:hypothetical protein
VRQGKTLPQAGEGRRRGQAAEEEQEAEAVAPAGNKPSGRGHPRPALPVISPPDSGGGEVTGVSILEPDRAQGWRPSAPLHAVHAAAPRRANDRRRGGRTPTGNRCCSTGSVITLGTGGRRGLDQTAPSPRLFGHRAGRVVMEPSKRDQPARHSWFASTIQPFVDSDKSHRALARPATAGQTFPPRENRLLSSVWDEVRRPAAGLSALPVLLRPRGGALLRT